MSESAQGLDSSPCPGHLTDRSVGRHWFAVYTTCRHEKRVAQHFAHREIECFLPIYRTSRRWKSRPLVTLDLPLFPGYLFVRISPPKRISVLQVPGVLSLVGGMGTQFNPLPELEIEALRNGLDPLRAEPHSLVLSGQRVRICKGALAGIQGIVVRKKNDLRVVLTLDLIMQSISLEVDEDDLEPMGLSPQKRTWKEDEGRSGDFAMGIGKTVPLPIGQRA
jgi:transcription antitermination factor NusG